MPQYNWNIVESGVKQQNPNPIYAIINNTENKKLWYKILSFEFYSFVATIYNGEVGNRVNTKYSHWLSSQLWGNVFLAGLHIMNIGLYFKMAGARKVANIV